MPSSSLPKETHAIILAAGVGRRLGSSPTITARPKAMLEFGGSSLLARHVSHLHHAGVRSITIVIGYGAEMIEKALAATVGVSLLANPDYREGSVVSLWTARDALLQGAPVLLMDADVLYDQRLIDRLVHSAKTDCMLLDREIEPGDEPVKLCVRSGQIVDFRKRPTEPYDWHGESVGFFRFSPATAAELAGRVETYVASGRRDQEYEEPIRDMIMQAAPGRFGFEDISGLPWTEIDFPEDVEKAHALLPKLAA